MWVYTDADGNVITVSEKDILADGSYAQKYQYDGLIPSQLHLYQFDGSQFIQKPNALDILKSEKIAQLQEAAKQYIEQFYPEVKQRSDNADKEYWGAWLLAQNSTYTADSIYKSAYQSALNILNGTSDLPTEVSNYPTAEEQAWEQLIKIALRVAFVQEVKKEYYAKKAQIEQATSEADLNAVDMTFTTPYPQGA